MFAVRRFGKIHYIILQVHLYMNMMTWVWMYQFTIQSTKTVLSYVMYSYVS